MSPRHNPRDPWRTAPVGEQQEQLLPRWFVILVLVMIPVAIAAAVAGFVVFRPREVPVAARRPPPAGGLTNAVGRYEVGDSPAIRYDEACDVLDGVHIAGTADDRRSLRLGLAAVCNANLPDDVRRRLSAFAAAGGVVRFAQFEATGVDSTAMLDESPPVILVNAKFLRTDPLWIAPLIVHDTTFMTRDASTAAAALEARRAEDLACDRILAGRRESRGCEDAEALLAMADAEEALRDAGFD